jgi:hypothetical protein
MENSHRFDAKSATRTLEQTITLGGRLSRRTLLIVTAMAGMAAGLFLGWNSLVAARLAPLIVAVLPCAAMCALGLCATRSGQKNASSNAGEPAAPKEPNDSVATQAADAEPLRSAADSAAPPDRA